MARRFSRAPCSLASTIAGGRAVGDRHLGPDRAADAAGLRAAADARSPAISGRPAIGPGATRLATTGCPAPGCSRRSSACCGRRPTGAGTTAAMASMTAIGGRHVGFYGGVNYGFGYGGSGYEGGRWDNGQFAYNRTVNNFGSVRVTNVYEQQRNGHQQYPCQLQRRHRRPEGRSRPPRTRGRERASPAADRRADRSTSLRPPATRSSRRAATTAIRRSPPPRAPPNSRVRVWCALSAPPKVRPQPERRTRRRSIPSPRTRPRRTQRPHYVPLRSVQRTRRRQHVRSQRMRRPRVRPLHPSSMRLRGRRRFSMRRPSSMRLHGRRRFSMRHPSSMRLRGRHRFSMRLRGRRPRSRARRRRSRQPDRGYPWSRIGQFRCRLPAAEVQFQIYL